MIQNYEGLVERIANLTNLDKEEINRKVEAKKAKLSGLISKEGAAQIVASELGISFDKQTVKVNEIMPGMRRLNLTAKIINLFPVREYNKNNRSGKVLSMIIADDTGNIRCVLWDTNHIKLFEDNQIKQEDVIEISNVALRNGEIHLTGFSDIKKSGETFEEVKTEIIMPQKKISMLRIGDRAKVRAVVVQIFEPRHFDVCPECKKKVVVGVEGATCETHGKVAPLKRALVNLVLDDGTESIRVVLFSDQIEKAGIETDPVIFLEKRDSYLGRESYFSGSVRENKYFNNQEFIVSDVEDVDMDVLIKELEGK